MNDKAKKFVLPLDLINEPSDLDVLSSLQSAKAAFGERQSEGQLSVDVAETDGELIILATMAGTAPDKIELHLNNDLLTIRGERTVPIDVDAEYFHKECFWGKFSRTIVLPVEVRADAVQAQYKNGVLIIRLPKASNSKSEIQIMVIDE